MEQEFSVQEHIETIEHHTDQLEAIDTNVCILFKRLDNQHEILQKLGALLTQVDSRMDEMARKYEWQAHVLKRMDYTIGKINEGTTHVQSFAVRNDEKMNIVLKYRDHMLNIFTNQKKMNATLEEILGDRSAGPSSAGPVEPSSSLDRVYAAGRGGLWDQSEKYRTWVSQLAREQQVLR